MYWKDVILGQRNAGHAFEKPKGPRLLVNHERWYQQTVATQPRNVEDPTLISGKEVHEMLNRMRLEGETNGPRNQAPKTSNTIWHFVGKEVAADSLLARRV